VNGWSIGTSTDAQGHPEWACGDLAIGEEVVAGRVIAETVSHEHHQDVTSIPARHWAGGLSSERGMVPVAV